MAFSPGDRFCMVLTVALIHNAVFHQLWGLDCKHASHCQLHNQKGFLFKCPMRKFVPADVAAVGFECLFIL